MINVHDFGSNPSPPCAGVDSIWVMGDGTHVHLLTVDQLKAMEQADPLSIVIDIRGEEWVVEAVDSDTRGGYSAFGIRCATPTAPIDEYGDTTNRGKFTIPYISVNTTNPVAPITGAVWTQVRESLVKAVRTSATVAECGRCQGSGHFVVPDHAPGCDGNCNSPIAPVTCPVPTEVPCEACGGRGYVP